MLVFLTGFMGVGKTTYGKELAQLLGLPFFDLDDEIEVSEKTTIADLFKKGESYFRERERSALLTLLKKKEGVIALGGGTICSKHNAEHILKNGIAVYLYQPWNELYAAIKDLPNRPLLQQLSAKELHQLYEYRQQFYRLSQLEYRIDSSFRAKKLAKMLRFINK